VAHGLNRHHCESLGLGQRPYHPGYFAAFVLDPDGNNIEAVFHGVAKRSTPAIELEF